MNYHIALLYIMNLVFVIYLLLITLKYGVQSSISASYYKLPNNLKSLFTLFCWGYALPAIILGVEKTPLMFLAGAGILFVGAAPDFRGNEQENNVHMTSAMIGVLSSQIAILFMYHLWQVNLTFLFLCLLLTYIPSKYQSNNVWWQEIFAFLSIDAVLFIDIFHIKL